MDEDPEKILRFKNLEGPPPRCSANSKVAQTCSAVWPELAKALRIELPNQADMGAEVPAMPVDMGGVAEDAGMSEDPVNTGGGSAMGDEPTCSALRASPRGDALGALWAMLLGGMCLVRRRLRA